jgi:hypothetical protein
MGIAFGKIEAKDRAILDTWLGENPKEQSH